MCGASKQQGQIAGSQQNFYSQMINQASQVFGNSSSVFNQLVKTFSPTVANGPNQYGFSAAQDANLRSGAITQAGQGYRNEKQALGDQQAAAGGGRAVMPAGYTAAQNAALATNYGNQTSNALSQITETGYEQGNKNYNEAVQGLGAAPSVFATATGASGAATGAGSAAASTANQIATQDNSWVSSVTGALGSIAGAALGNPGAIMGAFGGGGGSKGDLGMAQAYSAQGSLGLDTSLGSGVTAGV